LQSRQDLPQNITTPQLVPSPCTISNAAIQHGGTPAGCDTSWKPKECQVNDNEFTDNRSCEGCDILMSTPDDLLMVEFSCVHPRGEAMWGKASKRVAAIASGSDTAKRWVHARDGAPGYTLVPLAMEAYVRLGVEADKLLKGLARRQAQRLEKGICCCGW
jgi:hypothetical protein